MPRVWRKHMDSRAGGSDSVQRYPDADADTQSVCGTNGGTHASSHCVADFKPIAVPKLGTNAFADQLADTRLLTRQVQ